jgi:hypothetical protein
MFWEVSMTDGSSSAHLSKDKQSDLVREARHQEEIVSGFRAVSAASAATCLRKAIIPKFPEEPPPAVFNNRVTLASG